MLYEISRHHFSYRRFAAFLGECDEALDGVRERADVLEQREGWFEGLTQPRPAGLSAEAPPEDRAVFPMISQL
jgi:hypothetical protein